MPPRKPKPRRSRDPDFRRRYAFFRDHCGGWVGHNAEQAWKAARIERELDRRGWDLVLENDDDFNVHEFGDDPRLAKDIENGKFEVFCVGVGDRALVEDMENGRERRPWSRAKSGPVCGVIVKNSSDDYLRCLKAELGQEAFHDEMKRIASRKPVKTFFQGLQGCCSARRR